VPRKLQWAETGTFLGFGCSECNWKFCPSGAPRGDSLADMKKRYEAQRDKEFAAHVCINLIKATDQTEHRRGSSKKDKD
jgi:hypothetical protein